MRIALGIVSLFSSGGLQRDCLTIGNILRRRGHDVHLFTARSEPQLEAQPNLTTLRATHVSNHGRDRRFSRLFQKATREGFDVIVGFNKMPGLDVLYCADPSVMAGGQSFWRRLLPRYRTRRLLEQACFGSASSTHILMLSPSAAAVYQAAWGTSQDRMTVLPPTIRPGRSRPDLRQPEARSRVRAALGYDADHDLWLHIAAQLHTKGLDRALRALARRSDARLLVAGLSAEDSKSASYRRLAEGLGVDSQVQFLGHREDVPELMAAADLLVHPARYDMTGGVILEAIACGLPVVTTSSCGFAEHVRLAGAGVVLDEPFEDSSLSAALEHAREAETRAAWSRNACNYAAAMDFTRGLELAARVIEDRAGSRRSGQEPHEPAPTGASREL